MYHEFRINFKTIIMKTINKNFKTGLLILLLIGTVITSFSQDYNEKTHYVFGTFHTQNTTINGLSIGAFPSSDRYVRTNGIRLELPGLGVLGFMGVGLRNTTKEDEIVNGLNISTGTLGDIKFNGLTIAGVSQSGIGIDGVAIAGLSNSIDMLNGVQIAGLVNVAANTNGMQLAVSNHSLKKLSGFQLGIGNYAKNMVGLQIGIFNRSEKTKGLQIGLWNVNEKRKLPIINWNFK